MNLILLVRCTLVGLIVNSGLTLAQPQVQPQAQPVSKTLVIGMASVLRHVNPALQAAPVNQVGAQIFASPLRFDKDWNPQPYLAQSWSFQDDGKSLLLKLVPDATFHDGKPITSEDVAFSIMTIKALHPFNTMLAPVERVDTPSPTVAIIRLKHEYPALLLALSPALCPIMPKHIYGDGQDIRTHPRNTQQPIGSGPYRLTAFEPSQHVTLERYQGFFIKDRPKIDKLVFRVIPDPVTQMLELERGNVHMMVGIMSAAQIDQAVKVPTLSVIDKGGEAIGPVGWLEFNLRKKPYDDVRVRRAIAFAIDKEFIVKSLHRGASRVATGPIADGTPFYSDRVEKYKLDLDKSNRLLDEAGLTRNAQGVRFAMSIDYQPGIPDNYMVIANYLRSQLRKVGIDVLVRISPDFPTWAKRVSNWEHETTVSGAFMWGDPSIGVHRTWVSSNIRQGVIFSNTQGYSNPKVDALLADATQQRDEAKRKAIYADFQKILADEVPVAFTHVWSRRWAANKDLVGLPLGIWGTVVPLDQISFKR
jgi:peptide/nickel transport system substrate-binding protein